MTWEDGDSNRALRMQHGVELLASGNSILISVLARCFLRRPIKLALADKYEEGQTINGEAIMFIS